MRSSKSRSRNKSNRQRSLGNIVNRVFDSSGPEGKVRGTPQQIIEKYLALARDAQLSNDRVAEQSFLQHAEHYTRLLGEAQREQAERQQQFSSQRDEEGRDDSGERSNNHYANGNGNGDRNGNGNGHSRDQQQSRDHGQNGRQQANLTPDQPEAAQPVVEQQAAPVEPVADAAPFEPAAPEAPAAESAPVAASMPAAGLPPVIGAGESDNDPVQTPEAAAQEKPARAAPRRRAPRAPAVTDGATPAPRGRKKAEPVVAQDTAAVKSGD